MKNREKSNSDELSAAWSRLNTEQAQAAVNATFESLYPRVHKRMLRDRELLLSGKLDLLPVQYALVAARFFSCCTWLRTLNEKRELGPEFESAMNDIIELDEVIFSNRFAPNKKLRLDIGDALVKAGLSFADTSAFVNATYSPNGPGAPRDLETSARALNLKIRKYSYRKIVQTLSGCNKPEPADREKMRKRVKGFERIYKKCCDIIDSHLIQK